MTSIRTRLRQWTSAARSAKEMERRLRAATRERDEARQRAAALESELGQAKERLCRWEDRGPPAYDADYLTVWHKSVDFMTDSRSRSAYLRGMDSGHSICRPAGSREDIHIEWRVHVLCWAASHAAKLAGDFVECGVNTGVFSLAICDYVDFNATGKALWLFDTFQGIPAEQMSDAERAAGRLADNAMYPDCFARAQANFAGFPRARLVRGRVPESLATVEIDKVAYLSIDMNIAHPERAAIEFFWPKLVPGAIVVLDDYGWTGYRDQKVALDEFAARHGVEIMTLPTGQGMLLKP